MTPSSDQKTVFGKEQTKWASIMMIVFSGVLWFNGRLATVEANQVWMKATLTKLLDVKDWHPKEGE